LKGSDLALPYVGDQRRWWIRNGRFVWVVTTLLEEGGHRRVEGLGPAELVEIRIVG
jgi:hypothetical protein